MPTSHDDVKRADKAIHRDLSHMLVELQALHRACLRQVTAEQTPMLVQQAVDHVKGALRHLHKQQTPDKAPAPVQPVRPALPKPTPLSPSKPALVSCPICNVMVKASKLERHQQKVHAQVKQSQQPQQSEQRPAPASKSRTRQVRRDGSTGARISTSRMLCPHCEIQISADLLKAHLIKVHKYRADSFATSNTGRKARPRKNSALPAKKPSGRKGKVGAASRVPQAQGTARFADRDALDGGKELGASRREQGRFGSLPLYDSHDEDSRP